MSVACIEIHSFTDTWAMALSLARRFSYWKRTSQPLSSLRSAPLLAVCCCCCLLSAGLSATSTATPAEGFRLRIFQNLWFFFILGVECRGFTWN